MRASAAELMFRAILDGQVTMNERLGRIEERLGRIEESVAGVRLELATHEHPDSGTS
jgi:hypothetical protein